MQGQQRWGFWPTREFWRAPERRSWRIWSAGLSSVAGFVLSLLVDAALGLGVGERAVVAAVLAFAAFYVGRGLAERQHRRTSAAQ